MAMRHLFPILTAVSLSMGYSFATNNSIAAEMQGEACAIEDAVMTCAKSIRDRKTILSNLGSNATTDQLKQITDRKQVYADGDQREKFRISLERNRRAALRQARQDKRNFKRRRITLEMYEESQAHYSKAIDNYRLGLNIYRRGTWFSLVEPQPDRQ